VLGLGVPQGGRLQGPLAEVRVQPQGRKAPQREAGEPPEVGHPQQNLLHAGEHVQGEERVRHVGLRLHRPCDAPQALHPGCTAPPVRSPSPWFISVLAVLVLAWGPWSGLS